MKQLLGRFTSRKFLLAVAGIIYGILNNQPELVSASILAFLTAEGVIDSVKQYKGAGSVESSFVEEEFTPSGKIVTGIGTVRPADAEE